MSVPAAFAGRLTPHPRVVGAIRGIGTTIQMAGGEGGLSRRGTTRSVARRRPAARQIR
jgi:hypothetical protein